MSHHHTATIVRDQATVLDSTRGVGQILDRIGDHRVVLIGEATHGTHEFYHARAHLTQALIASRGFNIVAVEADWPDAFRANRWVRGRGADATADDALADFIRFPRWMWRNRPVLRFLEWLRDHNQRLPVGRQAGFFGLDLYSLHRSIHAVLEYLDTIDPRAAERARARYGCFEVFGSDPQAYGHATSCGLSPSCEREVVAQLVDLQRQAAAYAKRDGHLAADEYFSAEQNARVVSAAESYYRVMFGSGRHSWNLRDRHMMSTLEATLDHVSRTSGEARAVVWAHNSHLGDARATQMGANGELNLGQLVREKFGGAALSIGLTTHTGSVTAASNWDEPARLMTVRPSLVGSYERLFHDAGLDAFLLDLRGPVSSSLVQPRLERAIGVVYRPETERASHYFMASMARQFDLVIHYDETRALEPLELWSRREVDLPETFPTGV
jgi:erythromycin esterase-like protein